MEKWAPKIFKLRCINCSGHLTVDETREGHVYSDGKRTQCPGVYLSHPVPGGYKYGDLALQVGGVSRIGTIRYGLECHRTQTRAGLRWRGSNSKLETCPLVREGATK
jgi:hypothetical protein